MLVANFPDPSTIIAPPELYDPHFTPAEQISLRKTMEETTAKQTPQSQSVPPMTPATGETTATGKTWYSYFSKEQDREYFHEPISGIVSWVAPTCGPSGSPILRGGGEEEDSHNTPPLKGPDDEDDGMALKEIAPPRSLKLKLAYWAALLLASNVFLMTWTRYSLRQANANQAEMPDTSNAVQCEPCPAVNSQSAVDGSVTCEPVACEPVACEPVACEPASCEPVPCKPCKTTSACDCSKSTDPATSQYVQDILKENFKAMDQVLQHVREASPDDSLTHPDALPKVCQIPLAERIVPECREVQNMKSDETIGVMTEI